MTVPVSNMTVIWNDGAAHTAVKMNVTDTSSTASSMLLDLQIGGSTKLKVDKAGVVSGGTTSGSNLVLQSTSGSGTTDAIIFRTHSQAEGARLDTNSKFCVGGFPNRGMDGNPGQLEVIGTTPDNWTLTLIGYGVTTGPSNPGIGFYHTRASTPTGRTSLINGDNPFGLWWYGDDGSTDLLCGGISSYIDGAVSTNVMPTFISFFAKPNSGGIFEVFRISGEGGRLCTGGTNPVNTLFSFIPQVEFQKLGQGHNMSRHGWGGACSDYWCTSRGTTASSFTAVQNNDQLGVLYFAGADGSDWSEACSIAAQVDGSVSAGNVPGRLVFRTTASETTRLIVDNLGNIVIGLGGLGTGATDGFLYISATPGTPSGVPTTYSQRVPLVYDRATNKLYAYNGSWLQVQMT